MSEVQTRRRFLSNAWKAGFGLIAIAGVITSWDLLKPILAAGVSTVIRTVSPDSVPATGVVEVPEAKGYLVNVDGEVRALSEVCPHLGCRVPFVEETGQFECPCHGSKFTRVGCYVEGPAPRGLDHYTTEVVEGVIEIDTSQVEPGPAAGEACA